MKNSISKRSILKRSTIGPGCHGGLYGYRRPARGTWSDFLIGQKEKKSQEKHEQGGALLREGYTPYRECGVHCKEGKNISRKSISRVRMIQ